MKKILCLIVVQILFCTLVYAGGIVPPMQDPNNPEWVKGEILVKFKDDVELQISSNRGILETGIESLNELNSKWQVSEMKKVFKTEEKRIETKTIKTYTGEIIEVPQLFNIFKMKIPDDTDIEKAVEDFEKNPNVEYAEPNYIARICVIPDDPDYSQQWGLPAIQAPEAWDIETGDSTVVIGVIDTGVDWGHPDLTDKMVSTGYDFVNNDDDAMDDNGHGSHVAGIAAATTNNALGIAGVAWNCKILPVKVMQSNGYGSYSDIANGVNYAANNNAKVINLSLGGYYESYVLKDALETAYTTTVIVAAAGNAHQPIEGPYATPFYPAAWSFVIGVEGTNQLGELADFSNYDSSGPVESFNNGLNYEVRAPGVNIYSTIPLFHPHTYSYASWNGTSMAAPFVTGTVALLQSHDPDLSNELILGQLIYSSDQIINSYQALIDIPEPQLSLYSETIIDTLPGCDQDGIADAGETVEMVFDIQNTWGQAYNVEAILSYHSYEDTCFVTIIDSIATFGSASSYAHVNNETNPFMFSVKSSTPNNTDVYFDYEITCDGGYSFAGTFYITAQRGIEIGGIISENTTWSNDYLYIVTANTLVQQGVTLTIEPGTRIQAEPEKYIRVDGCLVAIGTEDSMIVFTSNADRWSGIEFHGSLDAVFDSNGNYVSGTILKYAEVKNVWAYGTGGLWPLNGAIRIILSSPYIANNFIHDNFWCSDAGYWAKYGGGIYLLDSNAIIDHNLIQLNLAYKNGGGIYIDYGSPTIEDNIIEDNTGCHQGGGIGISSTSNAQVIRNVIRNNKTLNFGPSYYGGGGICSFSSFADINNNLIAYNTNGGIQHMANGSQINNNTIMMNDYGIVYFSYSFTSYNNIINNSIYNVFNKSPGNTIAQNNYWGTTNTDSIDIGIWDFYDDFALGEIIYQPFETTPVTNAPGFLYQVEFNPPPPIGCEVDTFNLIFSKPMDISIQPYVTFGVCEPYTQHIIEGAWVDSTNWQGTYTFGIMTGDGINYLRVTTAEDCEGMEIPKDTRFTFVIDVTGASSVGFIAQAGIEEVDLEWHSPDLVDLMGYNMYRYHEITRSDFSDPILINTSMITDTTYCDMSVTPNITYYYMYTCISTDLIESDYSDPASATPFNAAYTNIKVFLEGPYDAVGDTMESSLTVPTISPYDSEFIGSLPTVTGHSLVDWIQVKLRTTATGTTVDSCNAFLLEDGSVVDVNGNSSLPFYNTSGNEYYIVIHHRNHLDIMSAVKHTFGSSQGEATNIDLTISGSVYGDGYQELETGIIGMYSGDINNDGEVTTSDYTNWYNAYITGSSGYQITDLNMDGEVTTSDYTKWYNNFIVGASSSVPGQTRESSGKSKKIMLKIEKKISKDGSVK